MRKEIEDIYPLTPLQQGMLFHTLNEAGSPIYFEQMTCRIEGDFDEDAFARACQSAVDRHGVLRTSFVWENVDTPVQVVHRNVRVPWDSLDWRGVAETDQQARLQQYLEEDRNRGFAVAQPPLMRVGMIRLAEDVRQLVWSHHHLLLDGWSVALLMDDVFATYAVLRSGRAERLPMPRGFGEYVAYLYGQDMTKAEQHWKDALEGFTSPTAFGLRRTTGADFHIKCIPRELTAEVSTQLVEVARRSRVTLNTVLQTAWALLVARYSGSDDIVYGTVVSGRPHDLDGIESMLGCFINTLPVRARLEPGDSVRAVLARMQQQISELQQYEYSSLVDVQRWSEVPREVPLFDSIFVFENYPTQAESLPSSGGARFCQFQAVQRTNFPVVALARPGKNISLELACHANRIESGMPERMADHWVRLLQAVATDPEGCAATLPMLGRLEHREMEQWNRTEQQLEGRCVHELFEQQVELTPSAVAVVYEDVQLTYGELNARANQWAHYLRQWGVGPDVLVAIAVERSLEMVVGLLAILKAGGAYVPLDPTYPSERLAYMLSDCTPAVLLTQEHLLARLPTHSCLTVCLDRDRDLVVGESSANPEWRVSADNLAYVIYTSGSTGRPKGAMNRHGSIYNRLVWMQHKYKLGPQDRVLQKTPFGFDVSVWEFFWPLMYGACLVIAQPEGHKDPGYLANIIVRERITTLHFVPSMLQAFLSEPKIGQCRSIRRVICSGEALTPKLSRKCMECLPWAELHNLYGPTEAAVDVTHWHCRPEDEPSVPIGRPIANTQIYILDSELQPVPIGVAGELYIGGAGLGRGYLNRPELTAERFVPNPFGEAGSRLYRSGDVGRWNVQGELEFLGRKDQQVKIRGYRIELGEIEAVLRESTGVREAVVMVREDVLGEKRLIAYVVGGRSSPELRRWLEGKLPSYMVPSALVVLEELPLTANGKLDRRALLELEVEGGERREEVVEPRTAEEEIVAGIWERVLGLEHVGAEDNFFELGGHSLMATQIMSRMRESFRMELPLRELFEAPTVAGLAGRIQAARREGCGTEAGPAMRRVSREEVLPLSFAQQRLWFFEQLEPGTSAYHIPIAVRLKGALAVDALERSLGEVLRRHEALRATFASGEQGPVQRIQPYQGFRLPVVDVSREARGEVVARELLTEEARRPFDLERGSLVRALLVRIGPEEHILGLTIHHIVSDGWSTGILIRELGLLYSAYGRGEESPLPELELQYGDYAVWQREWLSGRRLEEQIGYWREQLAGMEPLELPTDRVRTTKPTFRGGEHTFRLSGELSKKLKQLSREYGTTLFMTLLAGFQTLLGRYSGQRDIAVGTPIANRTRSEIELLIGFFVNTLVIRTHLDGAAGFGEVLKRVRESTLGAYAHQDLPFERLVEELQPERELSRHPLFQVMFAVEGKEGTKAGLEGLELSRYEIPGAAAKFDLSLSMGETDEGLVGTFEYSVDLFEAETIVRMAGHLEKLLEAAAGDVERDIWELELSGADEQRQMEEWNRTEQQLEGRCVHELFEEQAQKSPQAIAVVCGERRLTYAELNQAANRLAHHLRDLGVGPEVRVALCLERNLEVMIGLLGILKAGGVYLPLDPAYPTERLAFMIEDTQARMVLTQTRLLGRLLLGKGTETVSLDADAARIAACPDSDFDSGTGPKHAAYLIYTSGSTGRPKGVVVEHGSVCNQLRWMSEQFQFGEADRVMQKASLSFDASILEIFLPLAVGAAIAIVPERRQYDVDYLLEALEREEITYIDIVPSLLKALATHSGAVGSKAIRVITCGGEVLTPELVGLCRSKWRTAALVNTYGPTEATVQCTYWKCGEGAESEATIPIGRPIANTQMYVLDEGMQLVPIGVAGELYIGGAGLGRGYLNRPELTAERFVPNPFGEAGSRLYRSGDVGRWNVQGELEFLGRKDQQVKIRGYRIELGEIEAVLRESTGVREAVVEARAVANGQKRLVAYIVPEGSNRLEWPQLRKWVGERLPEYMVPAVMVRLDRLPLTANGKVDRRALPDAEGDSGGEGKYRAAETEVERVLVEIWQKLLGVEKVGVDDNFFELGGDSILSIQAVARAREAGLRLTPKQMFEQQTIATLARVAQRERGSLAEQGVVAGAVEATPIQRWFWETQGEGPGRNHFNQAVLLEGSGLEGDGLEGVIEALVRTHDALRLRWKGEAGVWRQCHAEAEKGRVFMEVDLSAVEERDRAEAIGGVADQVQRSLDVAEGPMIRVTWMRLGAGMSGRLLLAAHHLVIDGVSWRILLEDLQKGYEQWERGEAIALGEKTTSYQEWAGRLQEYGASQQVQGELEYWESEVGRGRKREGDEGEDVAGEARTLSLCLEQDCTRQLVQEAMQAYGTQINDLLIAALGRALESWKGEDGAVLVDLEGHGREEVVEGADLTRTVGWFTAMYPVAVEGWRGRGPAQVIQRVKEQLRQVPSKGIGYGLLRYGGGEAERRLAKAGQAEVSFNYLGQFDQVLERGGRLRGAPEHSGAHISEQVRRTHKLEVTAVVAGGRLQMSWTYNPKLHRGEKIQSMAEEFRAGLETLVAHCLSPQAGAYTPSDFPLARITQEELDRIVAGRGPIEDIYPLTPLQQGMLFHTLQYSHTGMYVEQFCADLEGELDALALQRAWEQVVQCHGVLRTGFVWEDLAEPLQLVERHAEVQWDEQDWQKLSPADQSGRMQAYLETDRVRGFDPCQAPLMRLALIRTEAQSFRQVWTHHHLLLDGWSIPLVLSEVFRLYEGFCPGQPVRLPRPRPYADYIRWLQQQDLSLAEGFWRETLKGFRAPTRLGVERMQSAGGAAASGSFEVQTARLTSEATAVLERLTQEHRLTLNTLVQGAWGLLLSRYSGQQDVLFGATSAGRPADLIGAESMVGLFINTLPVRLRLQDSDSVLGCLLRLQQQQAQARCYEYSPLVLIHGWSEVPRSLPLFESILVFENYPINETPAGSPGRLRLRQSHSKESNNYALTAVATPGTELLLQLTYDRNQFEAATIDRLLVHWQRLIEHIMDAPERRIMELELLGEAERSQVLEGWNLTEQRYPADQCLHELFQEQVRKSPVALAVVYGDRQLTYLELNREANRLAHYLRRLGVGPEVHVALCLERSPEMVIAILAVLKAGGAYVPLDPSYPVERLSYLLQDAGAAVLLTQTRLQEKLPLNCARVLRLDADGSWLAKELDSNLDPVTGPQNSVYVLYTSGSTGKPKGVVAVNHGLSNHMRWMQATYKLTPAEGVLQKTPFSFDASVWEFFWPLITGARLVLARPNAHRNPAELIREVVASGVTILQVVPSLLEALTKEPELQNCTSLSRIFVGGETLPSLLAETVATKLSVVVTNLYGPTEGTIDATAWDWQADEGHEVPIGRPIANTQIYILDSELQPVPIGVAGELYIGGAGLARGYLNRSELTAERFLPNPFGEAGSRLYRSGDVGRYRHDGAIEFLGRTDEQVKIRGYRIELGEIEAALREVMGVREAVVVVREDDPGEKRLIAYLAGDVVLDVDEMRTNLRKRLPTHMIPSVFVQLGALPLLPNGKFDRKRLTQCTVETGFMGAYVAPRDAIEFQWAQIFANVLGVQKVGVRDNFFDLGGHSLMALSVLARAERAFGCRIPLQALLEAGTVEALASLCRADKHQSGTSLLFQLREGDSRPPIFFVHPAGGNCLCYMELARRLDADQPVFGLQSCGLNAGIEPDREITRMAARYIEAIKGVQPQGPYLVAGWSVGGVIAFEMAQMLVAQSDKVDLLGLIDSTTPEPEPGSSAAESSLLDSLAQELGLASEHLLGLDEDRQLEVILEHGKGKNWWPPDLTPDRGKILLNVFAANVDAVRVYRPRMYPGTVTFFSAVDQRSSDPLEFWQHYAAHTEHIRIPGTHPTLLSRPNIEVLAAELRRVIEYRRCEEGVGNVSALRA